MYMVRNSVAKILLVIGIIEIILSFIVGVIAAQDYVDFNIVVALMWWIGGFVSGMLIIGFSEVINLLQSISSKLDKKPNSNSNQKVNNASKLTPHEDEIVFKSMRLYVGNDEVDGILKLSKDVLSFYRSKDESPFQLNISSIQNATVDDEVSHKTFINIEYLDNDNGNIKKLIFLSLENSEKIGYEIHNRIEASRK